MLPAVYCYSTYSFGFVCTFRVFLPTLVLIEPCCSNGRSETTTFDDVHVGIIKIIKGAFRVVAMSIHTIFAKASNITVHKNLLSPKMIPSDILCIAKVEMGQKGFQMLSYLSKGTSKRRYVHYQVNVVLIETHTLKKLL